MENLEGCESLEKLDLTLNFIGDIESVASLKANKMLKYLYLTGNPCTDYEGYRDYVIAKLPQIETLDNDEILRSERIKELSKFTYHNFLTNMCFLQANQILSQTEIKVKEAQRKYEFFRQQQKERLVNCNDDLDDEVFWKTKSEHAPETRVTISNRSRKIRNKDVDEKPIKKSVRLFAKDGRPLNINQAKLKFKFNDEDPKQYVLDLAVYR